MHQAECETPRQQGTRGVFISIIQNQAHDGWRGVMSALPPTSVHSATPPAMLCVSAFLSCGRLQTQMR